MSYSDPRLEQTIDIKAPLFRFSITYPDPWDENFAPIIYEDAHIKFRFNFNKGYIQFCLKKGFADSYGTNGYILPVGGTFAFEKWAYNEQGQFLDIKHTCGYFGKDIDVWMDFNREGKHDDQYNIDAGGNIVGNLSALQRFNGSYTGRLDFPTYRIEATRAYSKASGLVLRIDEDYKT